MKIFYKLVVVVLALIIEIAVLSLILGPTHGMIVAPYRRSERLAALRDSMEHPSPVTKAAFKEEMRLMHQHEDWKGQLALGVFVVINGTWIYYYFRHGHRHTTA